MAAKTAGREKEKRERKKGKTKARRKPSRRKSRPGHPQGDHRFHFAFFLLPFSFSCKVARLSAVERGHRAKPGSIHGNHPGCSRTPGTTYEVSDGDCDLRNDVPARHEQGVNRRRGHEAADSPHSGTARRDDR